MRTLILILLQVGIFSLLALWYQKNPGEIAIQWLGYDIQVSIAIFFVFLLVTVTILYVLLRFVATVFNLPTFFRSRYAKYNQARGVHAMEDSLVALYATDGNKLAKTGKYTSLFLKNSDIGSFFQGKAALINHRYLKAEEHFNHMLKKGNLPFLGYTGLFHVALSQNKTKDALKYVDLCIALHKKATPLRLQAADLALKEGLYERAITEFTVLLRKDPENKNLQHKKANALFEHAKVLKKNNNSKKALSLLEKSHDLSPLNQDIIKFHIQTLQDLGKTRATLKLIEKTWEKTPDEAYVLTYISLSKGTTDLEHYKALQGLFPINPGHSISLLVQARYALKAKLWGPAHDALRNLMEKGHNSPEIYRLMEELKQSENAR